MGSMGESPAVIGQYMLPFIHENSKNDDPWQRNYGQPPTSVTGDLIPRSYPLTDMRPLLLDNSTIDLLKSHGFGVAKHRSAFIDKLNSTDGELADHATREEYWPEMEQLVKDVLGAKHVIVMSAAVRQGKRAPETFKIPTGLRQLKEIVAEQGKEQSNGNQKKIMPEEATKQKLAKQSNMALAAPIRIPHMDFTDQGARASIRHQHVEVHKAAKEAIAFEDKLCADQPFDAEAHEANSIIDNQYNTKGELGPRYAAFSIWRPLRKVNRDPITLGPPGFTAGSKPGQIKGENVYWPYLNKYWGAPGLSEDFLKEFAMLGVNKREPDPNSDTGLTFYYVSGQEPDEVLFIKQFDSASRGSGGHAPAPWHGSPEIGSVEGDEPRESIELRIFAFW